ncbi:MAG: hypothetical protein U0S36_09500 [Candidatus Nanopelagicales bacterium]
MQDDFFDSPVATGVPWAIGLAFAVFILFFLTVVVLIIVSGVKRYRVSKKVGLDPFAGDIQMMGTVNSSALLAPERSVADRLAEIDQLAAAGQISSEEKEAARARILGSL